MQNQQRINITLKAFDHRVLDEATKTIVGTVKRIGAELKGPIPLPTRKQIFTVIRSPHMFKTSREQFKIVVCKRSIIIEDANPTTVEALKRVDIPTGVEVEVKLLGEK